MVYPPITRESTNRSSVEAFNFYQTQSTTPSILLHQPQLYTPYNPVYTCAQANLAPQYIYTNTRRSPASSSITFRGQDSLRNIKNPKWLSKFHGVRIKDYPTGGQHPLSYTQPPLVLYDPLHHLSPTPSAPLTPVYFNQATSFHLNSYLTEPYASVHPSLIPQSFYKPSEGPTFCLASDQSQNQLSSQQAIQQTYYNVPTNLNLQNVKHGFHSNSVAYPTTTGVQEDKFIPVVSNQLFSNSMVSSLNLNSNLSNKLPLQGNQPNESLEKIGLQPERRLPYTENFSELNRNDLSSPNLKPGPSTNIKNLRDEKYSDESSCFDFTIEAEKMVSALCNTSFHELEKDEEQYEEENHLSESSNIENEKKAEEEKQDEELEENKENVLTSPEKTDEKCNENLHENFNPWYLELLNKESKNFTSVGTQTLDCFSDESEYSELIKKTINYGCNEAEKILKNNSSIYRQSWLKSLSSGTKIACAKSSTCFPVFLGDEIFSQDLINAVMRISNGWLILDHYFNKQHQPSLDSKFDNVLIKSLKHWETATNDLLKHVIKTYIQLGSNLNQDDNSNSTLSSNNLSSSFPGDVCLYVNFGLFGESAGRFRSSRISSIKAQTVDAKLMRSSNLREDPQEQEHHSEKENKSKNNWIITEQSQPNVSQKVFADKPEWDMFTKDLPQHTLQYDFFLSHPEENINRGKLSVPCFGFKRTHHHEYYPRVKKYSNAVNFTSNINSNFSTNVDGSIPSILSTDKQQPFCDSYFNQTSYNNFPYKDSSNISNIKNRMTMSSQIETKNTKVQKSNCIEGETINLSAWFASMRNKRISNIEISSSAKNSTNWWEATSNVAVKSKDLFKNSGEHVGSSRNDINRQIQTLKNMRTIQTAPWIANQLINNKKDLKNSQEENDSGEDSRVYMKPGSYKVPKKKYQSRRSQRRSESKNKSNSLKLSQNCFEYDNSPSKRYPFLPSRKEESSPSSSISSQDVTWKAACASAEILLSSLSTTPPLKILNKTEVCQKTSEEENKNEIKEEKYQGEHEESGNNQENTGEKKSEITHNETTTPKPIFSNNDDSSSSRLRTSIKTDSWLIKTLEEAPDKESDKSIEDNLPNLNKDNSCDDKKDIELSLWENPSIIHNKKVEPPFSSETSQTVSVMTLVDVVEKATYSETVRRFSSNAKPSLISCQVPEERKKRKSTLCSINSVNLQREMQNIKQEASKTRSDKMKKSKIDRNYFGDSS